MQQLKLTEVLDDLRDTIPSPKRSNFDPASFSLVGIVGYRHSHTSVSSKEEYRVQWQPTRLRKIKLLTGFIDNTPLIYGIDSIYQDPESFERVKVVWSDSWVEASCILDCGEDIHCFWRNFILDKQKIKYVHLHYIATLTNLAQGSLLRWTRTRSNAVQWTRSLLHTVLKTVGYHNQTRR